MSDMVEKVARAICRRYTEGATDDGEWISPTGSLGGDVEFFWKDWVGEARAAIEAMRSPPDYVLDAMNPSGRYASIVVVEAWNDAIDAALSTKGE